MSDISIWIGSHLDMMELCSYYGGPGIAEETVVVMCLTPMIGQYLKLTGGGSDENCDIRPILQLCEIQAMGYFPGNCYDQSTILNLLIQW